VGLELVDGIQVERSARVLDAELAGMGRKLRIELLGQFPVAAPGPSMVVSR
jgi:hypothetical protein